MRGEIRKTLSTTDIYAVVTYKDPAGNWKVEGLGVFQVNGKATEKQAHKIVAEKAFLPEGTNHKISIDEIIPTKTTYTMSMDTFLQNATITGTTK